MAFIETVSCAQCGGLFSYERKRRPRKFCSGRCRSEAGNRAKWAKPIEVEKARRKLAAVRTCIQCGESFLRASGREQRFCSKPCARQYDPFGVRREIAALKKIASRKHRSLREIKARRFAVLVRMHKEATHTCVKCGAPMPRADLRLRTCEPCTASRKRADRSLAKAKRRAALRQGDRVDPIKVFERDGWRCHLCGGKTLKDKRGSYHDRAPELDHVVPLAKGGQHTYANTACACRKCNIDKADRIIGQPSLLAA